MEQNEYTIGSRWDIMPNNAFAGIEYGVVVLMAVFGREESLVLFPDFDLEHYDIPEDGYFPTEYAIYKYESQPLDINVIPLDVFSDRTIKIVGGNGK